MNENPEMHHRAEYIYKESPAQKKKRVNQLRSIFRHFLAANVEDRKVGIIAEKMGVPYKTVLQAITEGLNKKWK